MRPPILSDAQLNSARTAWRQYARAGIRSDAAEVRRSRGRLGLGLAVLGVVGLIAWGVMGRSASSKKQARTKVVSAEPTPTPTPMLGPAPDTPRATQTPASNVMPLEVENDGRGPVSQDLAESAVAEPAQAVALPRPPGQSPLAPTPVAAPAPKAEPVVTPTPTPAPEPAAVLEPELAQPTPDAEPEALPEPDPADEVIDLPPAQRIVPPATLASNARAFRRIPVVEGDLEPLGGVGEYGVHIDRIETGREVDHGHCESKTASFEGGEETANVCFRVLHRREQQRLTALWEHNGHVVRRTMLTVPKQRAFWTRASVRMREDQTGPWIVRVVSDDGVELARTTFSVR